MELKNLMKEVVTELKNSGARRASFQLSLNLENEKVEVSPYSTTISFKIDIKEKKK